MIELNSGKNKWLITNESDIIALHIEMRESHEFFYVVLRNVQQWVEVDSESYYNLKDRLKGK